MIIDSVEERYYALQWKTITEKLKSIDEDWSKWKIVPAPKEKKDVHK